MNQNLKKAIMTSISEVLETMLFMVIEFDEKNTTADGVITGNENITACSLGFTGLFSGTFYIWVPNDQLHAMTADFMGIAEDTITTEHTSGTIQEVLNMIAGNAFSKYDDKSEFQLGIPTLLKKEDTDIIIKEKGIEDLFIKVNTLDSFIAIKTVIK